MKSRPVDADDLLIKIVAALLILGGVFAAYSWSSTDAKAQRAASTSAKALAADSLSVGNGGSPVVGDGHVVVGQPVPHAGGSSSSGYLCLGQDDRARRQSAPCSVIGGMKVLYKCSGPSGDLTIGSEPCPPTAKTVWTRTVAAESRRRPATAWQQQQQLQQVQDDLARSMRNERPQPNYAAPVHAAGPSIECQMAKQARENYLAVVGLRRNFDMLRVLNERVWQACKGQ